MTHLTSELLTRELIDKLSRDNDIIKACLLLNYAEKISYEEALIGMVHSLVIRNRELSECTCDRTK